MMYVGLTWEHPRGYNALAAAERIGGPVHWDMQPLEGFESAPIADLCARYDLVVLDHPHLGEALASDCLHPLDNLFSPDELSPIAAGAAGPSYASYAMSDRQWALPLDAATQVMATRPDLTNEQPKSWDDVVDLSKQGGVALCLAGPHAFLSLLSVCAAIEPDLCMANGGWPEQETLQYAYNILARLAARSPASVASLNPIGILDHMSRFDDVALVPLIYGYVNYSNAARSNPIRFHDAPGIGFGPPGSIIGGTGIAMSRRARPSEGLRDHLLWLLSPETQTGFIPEHDGQPGLDCAWTDPGINANWGGFYENTTRTLRASTIRPRHDGYIAFQTLGSAFVRDAFEKKEPARTTADRLTEMFHASRAETRSPR